MGGERVTPPRREPTNVLGLFEESLATLQKLDREGGWSDAACDELVGGFRKAAEAHGSIREEATYNAGVAELRCGRTERARALFRQALDQDPLFHQARAQLARLDWAAGGDAVLPEVISELERAVLDSGYKNLGALVDLARAEMRRGDGTPDKDGENDLERAKRNLQRALAIDDGFLPAQNLLAQYYLARAKKAGPAQKSARGAPRGGGETQAIDLALLVATQGLLKAPNDAQLLNTTGLVLVEVGDLTEAAAHFQKARRADPRFVEAHMNYASVNMMFRGFAQAEEAYRAVVALAPKDYDAHLGLALALRGQVEMSPTPQKLLADSERLLVLAKSIDAKRPEAYFNHAILVEEYMARQGGEEANRALRKAIGLYREFVERAAGKPEFADAVDDVVAKPTAEYRDCIGRGNARGCKRGRILNVEDVIAFNEQSSTERARLEEERRTAEAIGVAAASEAGDQPN